MAIETIIIAILSSSVIAAIISSFISIYNKNKDFQNDFFREVINKRLHTYQCIESQIAVLKSSVLDDDDRMYHLMFSYGREKYNEFQQNLFLAVSYGFWISEETLESLIKLSRLFLNISREFDTEIESIKAGKKYYTEIASIRDEIERNYQKDMLELHKVKKFFKNKSHAHTEFENTKDLFTSKKVK